MKKFCALFLSFLIVASFGACSKPQSAPEPTANVPAPAQPKAAEPPAPAPAPAPVPEAAAPSVPEDPNYVKDVVYCTVDGVDLKMDIAKPTGDGPFPAIVCIHGGGWQLGNKSGFEPTARVMAANGYLAVTVAYRFAPKYKWPAQVEDVKCAVRYLRAHAEELKINPEKIGAIGHSAGANLSLMLGLTDPKDNLEGNGGYAEQSSKVQAVVSLSAPTNFATWQPLPEVDQPVRKEYGKGFEDILIDLLGTDDRTAKIMADASPITYADSGDAPVLTLHGSVDPLVPIQQAHELDKAIKDAGGRHKLVVVEGADHGFADDKIPVLIMEATAFFAEHLKGEVATAPAPAAPAGETAAQ